MRKLCKASMPGPIPKNGLGIFDNSSKSNNKKGNLSLLFSHNPECGLHIFDDLVTKLKIFQKVSYAHQTFEFLGYGFLVVRAFHTLNDLTNRFT
ncbi:Uncharacterised protein [Shigella sonnei]|nr:hypothetical protein G759_00305 [Escherichia coli HVH 98 (4-5799287)]GCH45737.1 hypothetical protein BvCmsJ49A_03085 [Escherichia coli]CSZ12226.1 Uncharacterised protein [Shigella sonnei]STL63735.1 Uncharacterised protein [Escherichia coli]